MFLLFVTNKYALCIVFLLSFFTGFHFAWFILTCDVISTKNTRRVSEAFRKKFGHCPKGGGGIQPKSKKFEEVLFSSILTLFWTQTEGRGVDYVPKVLNHFLPKNLVNIWILGYCKGTSRMSKMGQYIYYLKYVQNGGGGGGDYFGHFPKKTLFFF